MKKFRRICYSILGMIFTFLFLYQYIIVGIPNLIWFGLMLFFPIMERLEK